jgi:hypothetical protein
MDIDSSGFRTKPMSTASYTSHRYWSMQYVNKVLGRLALNTSIRVATYVIVNIYIYTEVGVKDYSITVFYMCDSISNCTSTMTRRLINWIWNWFPDYSYLYSVFLCLENLAHTTHVCITATVTLVRVSFTPHA